MRILIITLALTLVNAANAAQHWSGASLQFANNTGQPTDVLVANSIEFRRAILAGIYNSAQESSFNRVTGLSPLGTLWAASGLNGNPTFAFGEAANLGAGLNFTSWTAAYGGAGLLATQILNRPTVVKIPGPTSESDIYLDLTFTLWGQAHQGTFAYTRSTPPTPVAPVRVPAWPAFALPVVLVALTAVASRALHSRRDSRSLSHS